MTPGRLRLVLAATLGALAVGGFSPLEWSIVPLLNVAIFCWLLTQIDSPREGALLGLAWGLGRFLTGVSWIYVSLHDVGGMAIPLAGAATLLFCLYLALFPTLTSYCFVHLRRRTPWHDALLFAGLHTVFELLRGHLFTGFPWLALGYSQTPPSPLAGYLPLVGVYGVGFVACLMAALPAATKGCTGWRRRLSLLAVLTLLPLGGALLRGTSWTQPTGAPFTVSLLQGNIPQSLKWDPQNLALSIDSYVRLARENPADLVVLPETAIPLFFDQIPKDVLNQLAGHGATLMGVAQRLDSSDDYTNAAILLHGNAPEIPVAAYHKRHLVPFGEFIPPGFAGFLRLVNIPLAGFTAGTNDQLPIAWRGHQLMPNICYEDLFGEEMLATLPTATVLINMSNTAWFGHSLAQPQHLQIARTRAIETGRPMLRATNTGMTAAIAPDGTVTAVLEPFTRNALVVKVQGYGGTTPYMRWGNLPALLLALVALMPALVRRVMKSTKVAG